MWGMYVGVAINDQIDFSLIEYVESELKSEASFNYQIPVNQKSFNSGSGEVNVVLKLVYF